MTTVDPTTTIPVLPEPPRPGSTENGSRTWPTHAHMVYMAHCSARRRSALALIERARNAPRLRPDELSDLLLEIAEIAEFTAFGLSPSRR